MNNYTLKKKCRDIFLTIIAYCIYYIFRFFIPLKICSKLGYLLGFYVISNISFSRKQRALNNISNIFPNKTKEEVLNIYKDSCTNFVQTLFELPKLKQMHKYISVKDPHNLLEIFQNPDKPVLSFTGHYGNWELVGLPFINTYGYGIYKAPNNKYINKLFLKMRLQNTSNCNFKMITLNKKNILHLMAEAKKNNLKVLMLIDQKVKEGILANFLGKPAYTTHLLPLLAIKYKIPLIPVQVKRCFYSKNLHFTITIEKALNYKNLTTSSKDILTATEQMNETIAKWVKDDPKQWFWLYNRW